MTSSISNRNESHLILVEFKTSFLRRLIQQTLKLSFSKCVTLPFSTSARLFGAFVISTSWIGGGRCLLARLTPPPPPPPGLAPGGSGAPSAAGEGREGMGKALPLPARPPSLLPFQQLTVTHTLRWSHLVLLLMINIVVLNCEFNGISFYWGGGVGESSKLQ